MKFLRILTYPLHLIFRYSLKFRKQQPSYPFQDESSIDNQSFFKRVKEKLLGIFYFNFQQKSEGFRVYKYNRLNKIEEQDLGFQLARAFKKMFYGLVITILLSLIIDFFFAWDRVLYNADVLFSQNSIFARFYEFLINHKAPALQFNFPSITFVENFTIGAISAISGVLGLIFALYAVGFQLTTDKYSSEVSDYINSEKIGNFFFKLLIFTDLYLLYFLVEINTTNIYPYFAFLVSLILISLSVFGILSFKDSYLTGLKPQKLFGRMLHESTRQITLASQRKKFSFRSVSVIFHARKELKKLLSLLGALFEDLKRNNNWNDAVYTPLVFSQIMAKYINSKRYIDTERNWWFFQKYEEMKATNSTSLVLKLNYELQGVGPLNIPHPDYAWVENKVASWFKQFNQEVDKSKEKEKFTLQLISAYQTILFGEFEKDKDGRYIKTILGAYENQEFGTFNKFLDLFLELFDKLDLTNEEIIISYNNTYFAISQCVLDGFDYSETKKILNSLTDDKGKILVNKSYVENLNVPSRTYKKINDYYDRIKVEEYIEGSVVTPKEFLVKEIISDLEKEDAEEFVKQIERLAVFQEKIAHVYFTNKNYESLASLIRLRLEWFVRLMHLRKYDLAEKHANLVSKLGGYLAFIPREIIVEYNFQLQIEKIIFTARIENKEELFKKLLTLLLLNLTVLNSDTVSADPNEWIKRNRILVILGGFIYLVSEFEQKPRILIEYVQSVEGIFKADVFDKIVTLLADVKGLGLNLHLQLIESETNRYHHWFGWVYGKIDELPKTYDHVRHYGGLQEVADHPSKFIREISYGLNFNEETIIDEFSEWIQKRELVKKILQILKYYATKK